MRKTRSVLAITLVAAIAAVISAAAPAGAAGDFTLNGVGKIKLSGCRSGYNVCIDTAAPEVANKVWFGLRVFTAAPGTMTSHTGLETTNTAMRYSSAVGSPIPCISDFGGTGTNGGNGAPLGALDPGIAMVGGFVGAGTGCDESGLSTSKLINFNFNVTGPTAFAFYGAFYGTEAATWRGQVGDATSHPQWWNLWGNFTSLAYSTTQ